MRIKITGKNLDAGDALRVRVTERLEQILEKHFDRGYAAHVVFERTRIGFLSDCVVHLDSGVHLQAHAEAQDAPPAFELAADKLEKRLRRHRRRLKDHHPAQSEPAADLVLAAPSDEESEPLGQSTEHPLIVAETTTPLQRLSVSEAVMRLDLTDQTFLIFRNAAHGGLNVVYRRGDGNVGWLDPERKTVVAAQTS